MESVTLSDVPNPDEEQYCLRDVPFEDLSALQKEEVKALLTPFRDMWSGRLRKVRAAQHSINLQPGAKPFLSHPYRSGVKSLEMEKSEAQRMLQDGIITHSNSALASLALLVPNADASMIFRIDYRKLNNFTVKDSYTFAQMDEYFHSLGDVH